MDSLVENPLPIVAVGALLATVCGLMFLSRRSLATLMAFGAVVGLTLLMLVVERVVVTDREEVEQALDTLLAAVQSNELPSVLALIDPASTELRSEAEQLMPMVDVDDTGATAVKIEVNTPESAVSRCKGRLRGIHHNSGQAVMFFDDIEFHWVKRDGRWLLEDFVAYWKGKPLNAVSSLQGNRPTPATR